MINLALVDSFRKIEVEEGFETSFNILWSLANAGELDQDADTILHEMQRWHLLYGEEYERLCTAMGIDFRKYSVE